MIVGNAKHLRIHVGTDISWVSKLCAISADARQNATKTLKTRPPRLLSTALYARIAHVGLLHRLHYMRNNGTHKRNAHENFSFVKGKK